MSTEPNVSIRSMSSDDLDTVADLYREMYREQSGMGMVMSFQEEAVRDLLEVQVKSRFFISLVLVDGDRVTGFAVGSMMKTPTKYKLEGQALLGFIQDVYVPPLARKSGAGRALVAALEAAFRAQGISYVELHVLEGNEIGQAFWQSRGYQPVLRVLYKHLDEGESM
ncbi:GNAT family N-acetyltransferase [Tumebacillus permanentifrigoris]|uniref:Ribosomal protein S18 acetylase RimI-like enzyme n=1 Tax=Tumebacillus permanentifrigoris TaxID=378543 RepID=A0A316D632_9BACL|nr:GNAT family N-acetyltransferase [Tumebacillus permanentifrigoris]PWK09643.1 ribosomal protein S18 acetylase RimI-like enzyme [Tumebacillus permanentifrigoris]